MNNYRPTSLQQITDLFITSDQQLSIAQMARTTGLSERIIHKYIKALVEKGILMKIGSAPRTSYQLSSQAAALLPIRDDKGVRDDNGIREETLNYTTITLLDQYFLKFDADGTELKGYQGFVTWCQQRKLNIQDKADSYIKIIKHIDQIRNDCGLLDATQAFSKHVDHMNLDLVYYADQYKWMDFGRGKLAELTFYAKQSQNRKLITQSIELYKNKLEYLIRQENFDAIAFVPASITRQYQLLTMIDYALQDNDLPRIKIEKFYRSAVKIPQKSLKMREQRIKNAQQTIYVRDPQIKNYHKVLLIDDFVGSGSTLNETACKLKAEGVTEVIGFAIVGNMDLSYEVINEV
jgi:biotin operon repressor